jgi:alpha-glucosidase
MKSGTNLDANVGMIWRTDPSPTSLGEGITRFRDPASKHLPLRPFPAYEKPPTALGPAPRTGKFAPIAKAKFALQDGWHILHVPIDQGTSLYGTGEQAGPLLRNGITKTLWNTDAFDYNDKSPSIYQSHPWVLAVRKDGTAFGVIIETTARVTINLKQGITAMLKMRRGIPTPAITIIEGETPQRVLQALASLTGRMPLPPLWALGYHQCRWSYEPDSQVREIAKGFRDRDIPCDVIWLDIDYMNGFRCFTFDETKFPSPEKLFSDLHDDNFKVICMIDPGLKVDPDYSVYVAGKKGDHYVKTRTGEIFIGEVWPGDCAFPDFTQARTREWWASLYAEFIQTGIDGVWNDMNEPAVFKGVQKSMPAHNRHNADTDLGGPGDHEDYHNIYGMQMARGTREGILDARPDVRPFVLTRANFLGGQRYAAMWTGDNRASWDHLKWSISMALNMGLSAQPFAGPDIGGFVGESEPVMFARWMGIGALLPFARGHKIKEAKMSEPWMLGPACERTCKLALERRYRLLPQLYSLFREASATGLPVVRPAFFADLKNPRLRSEDANFLLGDDIFVRCDVLPPHKDGTRVGPRGELPKVTNGEWKQFDPLALAASPNARPATNSDNTTDADLPELWLRPGAAVAIFASGKPPQSTKEFLARRAAGEPLTLLANFDNAGKATCTVYQDAGDGFDFERDQYALATYTLTKQANGSISVVAVQQGAQQTDAVQPQSV